MAIDPFGDMSALARARGMQFDYPRITGVEAELLLVTHEHLDHNGVEAIAGDPAILRSTAGRLESPLGEVTAIASEHDEHAGTARGPEHDLRVHARRAARVPLRRLRPERAAPGAGRGDRPGRPAVHPRRRRSRRSAPSRRRAIVARLSPRWVVPMHYRTPRIGFLETADAFLEGSAHVERLPGSAFDTGELPAEDGPLVVVPAAP